MKAPHSGTSTSEAAQPVLLPLSSNKTEPSMALCAPPYFIQVVYLIIIIVLVAAIFRGHVVHEPRPLRLLAAAGAVVLILRKDERSKVCAHAAKQC